MEPNKVDFSTGSINVGNPGDALISFADRQSKLYNDGLDRVLQQAQINEEKRKWDIANKRAEDAAARERNEYNRVLNERQVLSEYASKPLDTATMIDSQRTLMDEALIERAKQLNRPFTEEESAQIVKVYDSIVPFREDVENKIYKDLVGKNVDPVKAKQYAQLESEKYQSIPEYQKYLTDLAEKKTASEKERFKDTLELSKFQNDAYKTELDKYKTKMDLFTKMIGGSGGAGSTAGGIGGFSQDKSKAYEKAYTKAGNEDELVKRIDAAFTKYGAKAVNNALAASGIDEPVKFFELDVGRRDVALDRFDRALENERPISELRGQFGADVPIAPTYNLPSVAQVYTPESARATAQMNARDRLMSVLGGEGTTTTSPSTSSQTTTAGTSETTGPGNTLADRNNNPGNLVTTKDNWLGKIGDDGKFVKFQTYELGSRALAKNLYNGAVGNSIESYMNKYAPKNENDTDAYIKQVAKELGKNPGDKITESDIFPLMKAIAKQEGGKVDEDKLKLGYEMAALSKSITPEIEKKNIQTNREALLTQTPEGLKVNEKGNAIRKLMFDSENENQTPKLGLPLSDKSQAYKDRVAELKASNGDGLLDDIINKSRAIADTGISREEATALDKQVEEYRRSKANTARARYLTLKNQPEGTRLGGKTKDEWFDLMSETDRLGTYLGPLAPIVAAAGPLAVAALPSSVPGTSLIVPAGSTSTTVSSGLGGTAQLFPRVSELFSKPLTKESVAELQEIAKKAPELKIEIIKQLQRAGIK